MLTFGRSSIRFPISLIGLIFGAGCLASSVSAAVDTRLDTPDGIFVKVTKPGFALLSDVIKSEYLKSFDEKPMPPFTGEIGLGGSVLVEDLTLSVHFTSLSIEPTDDGIAVSVGIDYTTARAGRMTYYPGNPLLQTVCEDTDFLVSQGEEYFVNVDVGVSLAGDQIEMTDREVSFGRGPLGITIEGPTACDGMIVVREIKRLLVRSVLQMARFWVTSALRGQLQTALAGFETELNRTLRGEFPVELSNFPALPGKRLVLTLAPSRIETKADHFRVVFAIDGREENTAVDSTNARPPAAFMRGLLSYATLGANPEIINELVAIFLSEKGYRELDPSLIPGLAELLSRSRLSNVWPDLNFAKLSSDRIRAFVEVHDLPRVELSEEEQSLRLSVPRFSLKLMVEIADVWRDYFFMDMSLAAGVVPELQNEWLTVNVSEQHNYDFSGRWAETYSPETPIFEREVLDTLLASLFEYLSAASPIYRLQVPIIDIGNHTLTAGKLDVSPPWMTIDIVSYERQL